MLLRKKLAVLLAAAMMVVVMMATTATPAFAGPKSEHSCGIANPQFPRNQDKISIAVGSTTTPIPRTNLKDNLSRIELVGSIRRRAPSPMWVEGRGS